MTQSTLVIANQSFPSFRTALNTALQAQASNQKGPAAPGTRYAGQFWLDDDTPTSTLWTLGMFDGTSDVALGILDSTNHRFYPAQRLIPGGRLTLTSATPVTTADVTAATTVYYTPHTHDMVPVYLATLNNATFAFQFPELSLALDSNSGHTGYHQSGKNFDLFVTLDSGTLRLGTGPAWTSDTARGTGGGTTELGRLAGMLTNKNTMTLRFGSASGNTISVAANQATYVGTMRASANGQVEDSLVKRFLANNYNAVSRTLRNTFTTTRATTSASFIELNSEIRIEFVTTGEETLLMAANGSIGISTTQVAGTSIGIDGITPVNSSTAGQAYTASATVPFGLSYNAPQSAGYHYATLLGTVSGGATATWAAASALTAAVRM